MRATGITGPPSRTSSGRSHDTSRLLTDHGRAFAQRTVPVQAEAHDAACHEVRDEQISAGLVDHANGWSTATAPNRIQLPQRGAFNGKRRDDVLSIDLRGPTARIEHSLIGMNRQIERIAHFGRERDVAGTSCFAIERESIETAAHVSRGAFSTKVGRDDLA